MHCVSWGEFAAADPDLAEFGKQRLHGRIAYLSTVTPSGRPRVHPVTPIVAPDGLYVFMEPASPKGRDLDRDPRYALHCGVEDNTGGGGEFFVNGAARRTDDPGDWERAAAAASYVPSSRYVLFELLVSRADRRQYSASGAEQRTWKAG